MDYNTFNKAKDLIKTINELSDVKNWSGDGKKLIPQPEFYWMFSYLHKNNLDIYTKAILLLKEEVIKELENKETELKNL